MKTKNEILGHFREIQLKFPRLYTRILAQADLTLPQFALLSQLAARDRMPMTEISGKLFISKPAVTNLVDRLEKKNYIKRLPCPEDRRVYLIQILPKGKKIIQRIRTFFLKLIIRTLGQFSRKEQLLIGRFYGTLSRGMDGLLMQACKRTK